MMHLSLLLFEFHILSFLITYVGAGHDVSRSQDKDANGPLGIPALPVHNNSVAPVRPATSGSSREQSDDDELEGETEITEGMDPADVKRVRR